ncbi:MAG: Holliday junction branch migration protein RuvA [Deltaproteobacteria bacterium HGW-Deltaproteobacteria-18]|nr:MAG: Holliday junction branch migration protein RuvA [Deltaproteobacteria bacterium HGW-Deltaproteobacteria-18]
MIAYLEGTILRRDEESCVLLTAGGVGYQVHLTTQGVSTLGPGAEVARLFIHTLVREDALVLYGFTTWEERQAFVTLLAAPKLGPRTALAMLGCYGPAELAACIAREDVASLTRVPGIGAKTAKRLLLDLKDKLVAQPSLASSRVAPVVSAASDCAAALVSLGYGRHEVDDVVKTVFENEPDLDAGSAIRQALKIFAAK